MPGRGISNFQLGSSQKVEEAENEGRERERERDGPKEDPAQSGDKRVVRTVLNRSEYLYAASFFAPFLPCLCRRPPDRPLPSLQPPRLHGPMRYLLDYPVLINSSGFIFIFLVRRHLAHEVPRDSRIRGWNDRGRREESWRRERSESGHRLGNTSRRRRVVLG